MLMALVPAGPDGLGLGNQVAAATSVVLNKTPEAYFRMSVSALFFPQVGVDWGFPRGGVLHQAQA